MKHILLIGNLDGHSVPILRYAGKFCKDQNLKLHILQIEKNNDPILLSSPYYYNLNISVNQDIFKKMKALESFVFENTKDLIDTDWISDKLMQGNIQYCLDEFINEEKIDLLLVRQSLFRYSAYGQSNVFKKIFMNVSDLPILIVPANQVFIKLKRMAYFTLFSEDDFEHIQWLSKNFSDIELDLIHFSDTEESLHNKKWLNYLNSELNTIKINYKRLNSNIKNYIQTEVNQLNPVYDFIGMTTKKRNFWQRFTDRNTTLSLITELEVPALIFKQSNE